MQSRLKGRPVGTTWQAIPAARAAARMQSTATASVAAVATAACQVAARWLRHSRLEGEGPAASGFRQAGRAPGAARRQRGGPADGAFSHAPPPPPPPPPPGRLVRVPQRTRPPPLGPARRQRDPAHLVGAPWISINLGVPVHSIIWNSIHLIFGGTDRYVPVCTGTYSLIVHTGTYYGTFGNLCMTVHTGTYRYVQV